MKEYLQGWAHAAGVLDRRVEHYEELAKVAQQRAERSLRETPGQTNMIQMHQRDALIASSVADELRSIARNFRSR